MVLAVCCDAVIFYTLSLCFHTQVVRLKVFPLYTCRWDATAFILLTKALGGTQRYTQTANNNGWRQYFKIVPY